MMKLFDFILMHTIVGIGTPIPEDIIFAETIVDAPDDLISILDEHHYISQIRWWDRVPISTGSKIGYGGPRDPRDSDNYFFAETDIFIEFKPNTTVYEYSKYLEDIRQKYSEYDLYPAFDISIK